MVRGSAVRLVADADRLGGSNPLRRGRTDLIVWQPTARVGYAWRFANGRTRIEAAMSLGGEINVRTRGERVGQGLIVLGGIAVNCRW